MVQKFSLFLPAALLLAACASPTGSGTDSPTTTVSVGGTVLKTLNLKGIVTTFSGNPDGADNIADGPAQTAVFNHPGQMATDGTFLYVSDQDANAIRRVSLKDGRVLTLAGPLDGSGGDEDGVGDAVRFNRPYGITYLQGDLYIADSNNHKIRKLHLATGEVTTLAGSSGSSATLDGVGVDAHFNLPYGVTNDGTFLYVCDASDSVIRRIDLTDSSVTTVVGQPGTTGTTDAVGTEALLKLPYALTSDGQSLFVSDAGNYRIRKVNLSTWEVTTIAGLNRGTSQTGPANEAALGWCESITTDGTNVYFGDWDHLVLYKLTLATSSISPVAGGADGDNSVVDGQGTHVAFIGLAGLVSDGKALYLGDYSGRVIRKIR